MHSDCLQCTDTFSYSRSLSHREIPGGATAGEKVIGIEHLAWHCHNSLTVSYASLFWHSSEHSALPCCTTQKDTAMYCSHELHMDGVFCLQLFLALLEASSLLLIVQRYGLFNFSWTRWMAGVFRFPSGNFYNYAAWQKKVVWLKVDQLNMWVNGILKPQCLSCIWNRMREPLSKWTRYLFTDMHSYKNFMKDDEISLWNYLVVCCLTF